MFLPNTYSFVLTRRTIVDPIFTPETRRGVFLPNTDSFLLRSRPIVEPIFAPEEFTPTAVSSKTGVGEQSNVSDQGKRNFLKVAGVVGASAIASQILSPKKASAFIMGSSPTTGVVGVKNAANTRINPATEETVSTLATEATVSTLLKPSDLTFDAGNLQVKVTAVSGAGSSSFSDATDVAKSGLVDVDRHVQVDVLSSALPSAASTENTLETISFGGVQFALRLATDGAIDYVGEAPVATAESASAWRIKKVDSTTGVTITWADGNANFDNTWTGYAGHTYS